MFNFVICLSGMCVSIEFFLLIFFCVQFFSDQFFNLNHSGIILKYILGHKYPIDPLFLLFSFLLLVGQTDIHPQWSVCCRGRKKREIDTHVLGTRTRRWLDWLGLAGPERKTNNEKCPKRSRPYHASSISSDTIAVDRSSSLSGDLS